MRIPVSIITGALGSGKTTLLNHLLTENHGIKIGVIVNEFGDIGVDADLIVSSTDDVIELANGCVCCTVRGDLMEAVRKILDTDIEYLLIETSGMAEPGPVANTFLVPELPEIRARTKLDGIITLVDAEHFFLTLDHTAEQQVAAADVVLLNKADLVMDAELERVERKIEEITPKAYIFRTIKARAPLNILLATGRFDIDRWIEQGWDKEEEHEHAAGFTAVAVTQDRPLSMDRVGDLVRTIPPGIFRAKGVLNIGNLADSAPERDLRMLFQKVGRRVETFFDRPWKSNEPHASKIVLIGTEIDREHWQRELDKCALQRP